MSTVTFSVARNDIKNVVDEDGDLSQVAVNVPSFEYNANGTYKGMLVESTSQNEIRNSEGGGSTNGVIGSGGVLPTNWDDNPFRLTAEVIGTGTEKGVEYIDINFSGTAVTSAFNQLTFEGDDVISASVAENWTHSLYLKIVDDTTLPEDFEIRINEIDNSNNVPAFGNTFVTPTSTLTRYSLSYTTTDASIAYVQPSLKFRADVGETYDFTIRIGLPQLEEKSFPSSVIKTTSAAVERLRDDIKNTSASTYVGQTEGTVYAEVQIDRLSSQIQYIMEVAESTTPTDNAVRFLLTSSNDFSFRLDADDGATDIDFATSASTGNHKLALVYKSGDVRAYLDGSQVGTTNTSSWSFGDTLSKIIIGDDSSGIRGFDNWIRAFAFYKRALTDSEAKILTQ